MSKWHAILFITEKAYAHVTFRYKNGVLKWAEITHSLIVSVALLTTFKLHLCHLMIPENKWKASTIFLPLPYSLSSPLCNPLINVRAKTQIWSNCS